MLTPPSTAPDFPPVRKIQAAMLPQTLPSSEEVEFHTRFFPGRCFGGDLFDCRVIADNLVSLLMLDVGFAGMQALLVAAMAKLRFNSLIRHGTPPFAVVDRVNKELLRNIGADLRLTAFLGYLDLHDTTLTYCNIGQARPLIYRQETGVVDPLSSHGTTIGTDAEEIGGEDTVLLAQGDCLVLFSDGFYRLFGGTVSIGHAGAEEFIRNGLRNGSVTALLATVDEKYGSFTEGCAPEDDISVIGVEMTSQPRRNQIRERLGFSGREMVYLQYLNHLEEMDRATTVILSTMDSAGYPDDAIRRMKIVLTELLANAIVHGNRSDGMKKVTVGHSIDRRRAVVSIMDEGEGFDPSLIPDPTLPENLDKPFGRGLFIVRRYVDSIMFNTPANRVTVIKNNTI